MTRRMLLLQKNFSSDLLRFTSWTSTLHWDTSLSVWCTNQARPRSWLWPAPDCRSQLWSASTEANRLHAFEAWWILRSWCKSINRADDCTRYARSDQIGLNQSNRPLSHMQLPSSLRLLEHGTWRVCARDWEMNCEITATGHWGHDIQFKEIDNILIV